MKILIEEYKYKASDVRDIIRGLDALEDIEGNVSFGYVGYFYNPISNGQDDDCVFILPKVLLKNVEGTDKVFGEYRPEDIINLSGNGRMTDAERHFVYKFAVWIYRAIVVFNNKQKDNNIVYHKNIVQTGRGKKRQCNTFLDILLLLLQFDKLNRYFFFYMLKNTHSGLNKINWTRTISTQKPIIRNGTPIYLNPVNKKRQINFDEELLVIFYSILNYISEEYGFPVDLNLNFPLIKGRQFQAYIHGLGKARLHQIKYKYFSDKAKELWELCYAFFDSSSHIKASSYQKDYLLVKDFNIVFEAIIDELIGDNPLPDQMTKMQGDGKIVDHLFTADSLVQNDQKTYYIGDSKYYKAGHVVGDLSVYKQYTYARNVIQYNLDIFNSGKQTTSGVKLRDELTEGYNIIPNFFISATMNEEFDYTKDGIQRTDRTKNRHRNTQFQNRLFDRDTLLLFHYDVNFLFVLALYARNNTSQKAQWKTKIRERFRKEIQEWLQEDYEFYAMKARPGVDANEYIKNNFKSILGKIGSPFADKGVYSLALESKYTEANEALKAHLKQQFYLVPCNLGDNPEPIIQQAVQTEPQAVQKSIGNGVLMVMMERYDLKSTSFLDKGEIAIGLKNTEESFEIINNLSSIGYILFHTRKDEGQHLFALTDPCIVKGANQLDGVYKNIKERDLYVFVRFDRKSELQSDLLHSKNMAYTPNTRYDSQFATFEELWTS